MLDTALAKRFIEKITKYTEYNINIMDERGIIIASKTEDRIATFHEIAYQIITEDKDVIIVDGQKRYMGVKEGVNMAIFYKQKKIGVIGITGSPDEILPIAQIVKMSVETMLEYEIFKAEKYKRRNLKEQLLNLVLYGDNVAAIELKQYADKLSLNEKLIRIPVLISFEDDPDKAEQMLAVIRSSDFYSKQDLICITRDNSIIIYKYLKGDIVDLMQNYKFTIGEYMSPILRYLRTDRIGYQIFIGSMQNRFENYRTGYRHCVWLQQNIGRSGHSYYFYDYAAVYFHSLIPLSELNGVFQVFKNQMDGKLLESYEELLESLIRTNYNLVTASKEMHIHKNTLVYRLDKLREAFAMNPLLNNNEREFMNHLFYYLSKVKD